MLEERLNVEDGGVDWVVRNGTGSNQRQERNLQRNLEIRSRTCHFTKPLPANKHETFSSPKAEHVKAEQHGIAAGYVLARHGVRGRLFDQPGVGDNQPRFDHADHCLIGELSTPSIFERDDDRRTAKTFRSNWIASFLGARIFFLKKFRRNTDTDRSLLFTVKQRYESFIIARISSLLLGNV